MTNKIRHFVNRKYPLTQTSLLSILVISLGVGLFLLIFQPFGIVNSTKNKIILCLGFSAITFLSLFLTNSFKTKILNPKVNKWTILKEFLFINFVLLTITIGNYLYLFVMLNPLPISILYFVRIFFITISVGVFPIAFVTLYRYQNFKNKNLGYLINSNSGQTVDNKAIKFTSLNKSDKEIIICKNDFMYVEVVKNNIEIYYYDKNKVETKTIRNTLKSIEDVLKNNKTVFRCHRSFIVNTHNIKTAKGNSNGYKIYFKNYARPVPVSRSYVKEFQTLINE